jgi:protein TonB
VSYVQPQGNANRRMTGLAIVVAFHVVLGYALVNGLARKIVQVVTQPLETKIIEETRPPPPDKPPPPPPPKLVAPPPPYIPPPEVQVQVPQMAPTITAVTRAKPTEPVAPPGQRVAPPVQHAPVHTAPVVDAKACDKPQYPPAALRAQETGVVLVAGRAFERIQAAGRSRAASAESVQIQACDYRRQARARLGKNRVRMENG